MQPPEYHARALFKDRAEATDEHRLQAHKDVVTICNEQSLDVIRIGYTNAREIERGPMKGATLQLCWYGIQAAIESRLLEARVIPIMDKCNDAIAKRPSGMVRTGDIMRERVSEASLSLKNTQNVIGEIFYGDSEMSIGVQIADMMGYVLHASDCISKGKVNSYKMSVAATLESLNKERLHNCMGELRQRG